MEQKTCKICQIPKNIEEFPRAGTYNGAPSYRGECKLCNQLKQKTTPANKIAQKKYKTSAKAKVTRAIRRQQPEVRAKEREYEKQAYHFGNRKKRMRDRLNKKLKEDVAFRGIWYIKNALRDWVKHTGSRKNTKIGNYIGCTKEEFRVHIESKFTPEMNWNNHASYWEYDHKIPISSAMSMEEAYKLTHYTNIQPMEKNLNRQKSDIRSKEYDNIED